MKYLVDASKIKDPYAETRDLDDMKSAALRYLELGYTVFGPFKNKEKGELYYQIFDKKIEVGYIVDGKYYKGCYFDREGDSDARKEKRSW